MRARNFFLVLLSLASCKKLDDSFWDSSRLPTVRIHCSLQEWDALLHDYDENQLSEIYRRCENFTYEYNSDHTVLKNIGFRVKGSSFGRVRPETGSGKHNASALFRVQFALKFDETFTGDESVYGSPDISPIPSNKGRHLYGNEKLVLRYGNRDPSLTKSVLISDIRHAFDTRAVRYSFTKLYITIGNDPQVYYGVYQFEEAVDKGFFARRDLSTKNAFVYKCLWQGEQAKLQPKHALAPHTYIGEEIADPPNANAWKTKSFKPFRPNYDVKEGNVSLAIEKLVELITFLNESRTVKPPLEVIDKKFKVGNILRGLALDAYLVDYDSTWFYGNNYYLYWRDNEWDVFRYDYDTALRSVATWDLAITDRAPLKLICPLEGPGTYLFRLNASSLTFTMRQVKKAPASPIAKLARPSPGRSAVELIGVNGTNVTLIQGTGDEWTATFDANECFTVKLPGRSNNSTMMGLAQYSGLLSVPFLQFNRADANAPYTPHALVDLLLSYPAIKREYLGYVYQLGENLLNPANVMPRVQKYLGLIGSASTSLQVEQPPSLRFSPEVGDISTVLTKRHQQFARERPNFTPDENQKDKTKKEKPPKEGKPPKEEKKDKAEESKKDKKKDKSN